MVAFANNNSLTRRITLCALITAAAVIVHSVEALLPPLVPGVPIKLGLANVFTLIALIMLGARYALITAVLRCIIAVLITGAVSRLPYCLTGAILSFAVMWLMEKPRRSDRISCVGQSVLGSFTFNVGQIAVGILIVGRAMIAYFPLMSLISVPTGIFTGLVAHYSLKTLMRTDYGYRKI
ncbi:MAG: Gx transporter family protein [Clostridia bacterium]|nr:Gx transporter family protein [Clostridia bacterium]